MDEVGIKRGSAAIAEDPSRLSSQQARRQQFELLYELDKVAVSSIIVQSRCDEVVLHQFCNVGDSIAMMEADIAYTISMGSSQPQS